VFGGDHRSVRTGRLRHPRLPDQRSDRLGAPFRLRSTYPRSVDGVLYYPYIRVPKSGWFSRLLLYWDDVATIVPETWLQTPEELGPYTRELVQRELVTQVLPRCTDVQAMGDRFADYVLSLDPRNLERRRRAFRRGKADRIHVDKLDLHTFSELMRAGLCSAARRPWWSVERATANDYMAALALALAAPEHREIRGDTDRWWEKVQAGVRRVPVTDQAYSILPILSGTVTLDNAALRARAGGAERVRRIQAVVLERLFPAPIGAPEPKAIEAFRRQHGDMLPSFRREVEARVDEIVSTEDPEHTVRALDRLEGELVDAIRQVEAYLSESRLGRVARSRFCTVLGFLPGVNAVTGRAKAAAELIAPSQPTPVSRLAYAAFANIKLSKQATRPRALPDDGSAFFALTALP